jgi:hypothetical protein
VFTARYGLSIELCFKLIRVFPYSVVCVRARACVFNYKLNSLNNDNKKERLMLLLAPYELSVGKSKGRDHLAGRRWWNNIKM